MNARPLLERVAGALRRVKLEAILTGEAATARRDQPLTVLHFEFLFRRTPDSMTKLKALARELGAVIWRDCEPRSRTLTLMNDDNGLRVQFHDAPDFEVRRRRAVLVELRGPGTRPRARREHAKKERPLTAAQRAKRRRTLAALRKESRRVLRQQIRELLALPMEERTHFLRVRMPGGGTAL